MTSSRPSSSDNAKASSLFERFHPGVQGWIWRRGWTELREIQEQAGALLLSRERDVILSAPTAGGKTEAAFLPIASVLADEQPPGLGCLCVSPLKALINDQFERLEPLFEAAELSLARWHGDVPAARKRRLLDAPTTALIITPESLEGLFIRRGTRMPSLLSNLGYLVVDELHAFIGAERGRQLQALLHRVERSAGRRLVRVGLSATLGDVGLAAEFLRPGQGAAVAQVNVEGKKALFLQVRGYRHAKPTPGDSPPSPEDERPEATSHDGDEAPTDSTQQIAGHLFKVLRGSDNLVFANSRQNVEVFADLLRRIAERQRVPNEFIPHHGSLSKEIRLDAERRLKDVDKPTTVVCTSTLEMGIDVGSVAGIAQIGAPPSVASLRQRLGRSGRGEDDAAELRVYVAERDLDPRSGILDLLRVGLVRSVAMIELLLSRWFEPPDTKKLHLSTLVQQILSVIAQWGATTARASFRLLCADGPFRSVSAGMFGELLRALGEQDMIVQLHSGELTLGLAGEALVDHFEFYAAFNTPEEFRVVSGARALGSLPVSDPLYPGCYVIFAGRRWRVIDLDTEHKLISVEPAHGGRPPRFAGGGVEVHDRVRTEMLRVYRSDETPTYLTREARRLLAEGRASYRQLELDRRGIVRDGEDTLLLPWRGDRVLNALHLLARFAGLEAGTAGPVVYLAGVAPATARDRLTPLLSGAPRAPVELAAMVENKVTEKHDALLPELLLCEDYAARSLDVPGALEALEALLAVEVP